MRFELSNLRVSCLKRLKNTKWLKKNWTSWSAKSTMKETSGSAGEEATSWIFRKIENNFLKAFRKLNKFSTNKINFFINRYNLRWGAKTVRSLKLKTKDLKKNMNEFFSKFQSQTSPVSTVFNDAICFFLRLQLNIEIFSRLSGVLFLLWRLYFVNAIKFFVCRSRPLFPVSIILKN